MNLDNHSQKSALSELHKPGQAALRFRESLSQQDWAVLGIGLNDFWPLVEFYGDAWRNQVLELVAECLLKGRKTCGSPNDFLARLTGETFLVITQASNAISWEQELRKGFKKGILSTFPPTHLYNGMICTSSARRVPIPSLAIGIVTDRDGPFSNPRELLSRVTKARSQDERPALLFDLDSLMVTIHRLREEVQVAEHAPALLPTIKRFAAVTTGPIHDLRNALNILYEEARKICEALSDTIKGKTLITATHYSLFLLETCSELRFRGVGTPCRAELSRLLLENRPFWTQIVNIDLAVEASPEAVEVYADRRQIAQALLNLLERLVKEEGVETISVTCRNDMERGEIAIAGAFDIAMNKDDLVKRSLAELQSKGQPSLYVFQKLVTRYDGSIQCQPGQITLSFPAYRWQDVRSTDALREQLQSLRSEAKDIRAYLDKVLLTRDQVDEGLSLRDAIGLGGQVIAGLADEFGRIRQLATRERQQADENQKTLWESLEAGSHFCQLLTANLLALEGGYVFAPRATDVMDVLESVWRMLRSKIEDIAEFECDVETDLQPVKATEMTLTQVVMNLALNALEELARVKPKPSVSRLSFTAQQRPGAVQIDISDTGGGLPLEIVERLGKESTSTRQHVEGGIGLLVVQSILDELGGAIDFQSTPGKGTTASITLPIWEDG